MIYTKVSPFFFGTYRCRKIGRRYWKKKYPPSMLTKLAIRMKLFPGHLNVDLRKQRHTNNVSEPLGLGYICEPDSSLVQIMACRLLGVSQYAIIVPILTHYKLNCLAKTSGPLCTGRKDVSPPNFVKSRSHEIVCCNDCVALKFDRHHGSAAAEVPIKCQNDWKSLNPNPAPLRLREILR